MQSTVWIGGRFRIAADASSCAASLQFWDAATSPATSCHFCSRFLLVLPCPVSAPALASPSSPSLFVSFVFVFFSSPSSAPPSPSTWAQCDTSPTAASASGKPVTNSNGVVGTVHGASLTTQVARDGTTPKASAITARTVATTSAVTPTDPGAELVLQQAESTLLDEETMYALLQQDSLASPLSYHWSLPPTTLIKSSLGRAAWLSEQTKHWQNVPTPELQECLRHILSLLPREVISSENQRLWQMQPSVVLTFCRAMVAAKLPYTSVFRSTAKVCAANDRIVWEFETHGMPGPALAPTATSTAHYRWFQGGADLTLIGLFTAGRMLRTCSETVGMQPGETPYAFFGRAGFDIAPRENARKVAELQSHGKNRTGVIVSGRLCTSHHKMMGASTYWETLQCKEHELCVAPARTKGGPFGNRQLQLTDSTWYA